MPVHTELRRDNKRVMLRWSMWHVSCLYEAIVEEVNGEREVYLFPDDPYTFTDNHTFTDTHDGEVFDIYAGDIYSAWR